MAASKSETYDKLRYRIITNQLSPGEVLNEKELMKQYKIGRTPLREVFLQLQRDGLIQMIPRLGTLVAPLDIHEVREIVEIRRELEGLVGRLAAERITPDQLEALKTILGQVTTMQTAKGEPLRTLTQLDVDFHDILYQATRNRKLKESMHELQGLMSRFWYHLGFQWQEFVDQFDDFQEVLQALENKDGQRAQEALKKHIDFFVERVKTGVL